MLNRLNNMLNHLNKWLLPATIIGFMGPNILYLSDILSTTARWGFVILLSMQLFYYKKKIKVPPVLLILLCLYSAWCIVTSFWSSQFNLSILKGISAATVLFTCLFAGSAWVMRTGGDQSISYLGAFSILTLIVAVLGFFFNPDAFSSSDMFQGYTYNSNVFGALAAISSAYCLWKAYKNRDKIKMEMIWILMYFILIYFIIISQSRAALLMVICITYFFIKTVFEKKILSAIYGVVFLFTLLVVIMPGLSETVINRVVYKDTPTVFYTREAKWGESLTKAQEGGWVGGGFGVSIDSEDWSGGFTASSYGREKANSQLAVIEEIGIIGLSLYVCIIVYILKEIYSSYRVEKLKSLKVSIALILGIIISLIVQSIFEGWWVALGSIDAVLFWTTTGVGIGLSSISKRRCRLITPHIHNI